MARHNLTYAEREKRRQLTNVRQSAVRQAWKNEQNRVKHGNGTRDWSVKEQKELLETGHIKGYEGHHMKSVREYPEEAGNAQNIQFLTEDEHLNGAHQGSYHNATNGYYDPNTRTMNEFTGDELKSLSEVSLSESYINMEENAQDESNYMGTTVEKIVSTAETDSTVNYMGTVNDSMVSSNEVSSQSEDNSVEME